MAIKTFKMKNGPVPKKVTPYLKRVAKSFGLASVDVVSELNPTISSMARDTRTTMQDIGYKMKDMYGAGSTAVKDLLDPKGDNAVHSLIDSLKTGDWYKRNDPFDMGDEDFDFGDDWGDDDFESSSDSSSEASSGVTAQEVAAVGASVSTNFGKVSAMSAEYIVKNNKIASQALYTATTNGFSAVNMSLSNINAKIQTLAEMQAPLLTQAQNTFVFQTRASEFFENTNAQLNRMADALEQIKANTDILNASPSNKRSGKNKITLGNLITGGDFDLSKYFEFIKTNIKESTDMLKMFGSLGTMAYGKNFKGFSVTSEVMKKGITSLIPSIYRDMMKDFNESLSSAIPLALKKLGDKNARGKLRNINPMISMLLDFILPGSNTKTTFNSGNYNKGPVPWDGVARKALVEVIPTYLAKIYASLGGEEKYFDYETGKYVSLKTINSITDIEKHRIYKNNARDIFDIAGKRLTNGAQKAELDEWLQNVAYGNSEQDIYSLINDVAKAKRGDKVQGMSFETARRVASVLANYTQKGSNGRAKMDTRQQAKMHKAMAKLLQVSDDYADYLYRQEDTGHSLLNIASNDFYSDKNKKTWNQREFLYSIDSKMTTIIKLLSGKKGKIRVNSNGDIIGGSNRREKSNIDSLNYDEYENGYQGEDYWELKERVERLNKMARVTGKTYKIEDNKIVEDTNEDDILDQDFDKNSDQYKNLSIAGKAKYNINQIKKRIQGRRNKPLGIYDKMYDVLDKMSLGLSQMLYGDGEDGKTVFDRLKDTIKEKFLNNILDPIKAEFGLIGNYMSKRFSGVRASFDLHRLGIGSSSGAYNELYNKKVNMYNNRADLVLFARQRKLDSRVIRDIRKGLIKSEDEALSWNSMYKGESDLNGGAGATIEQMARGGMVTKSGLIAVSKGEIVIPSDYNPRYYGSNNKRFQYAKERNYINNFYGSFAGGTDEEGVAKGKLRGTGKKIAVGIKTAAGTFAKTDKRFRAIKGHTDNAKKAYEDAKDQMIGIVNSALESGDKLAAQIGIVASGAFNIVTGGITDFMSAITGKFDKEEIEKEKASIADNAKTIFGEISDYRGAMGVGAIAGTGVSLLSGAVVGPIAGAAIGAGSALIFRSQKIQEMLFGKKPGESEEDYANSMRSKIKKFIQGDASRNTLFGSVLGAAAGTFAGSPLIGMLVGGAAGFVASSQTAQNALFGSLDSEGHHTKALGRLLDKAKIKLPAIIAGSGIAALVGGPFGFVGNLAIGGALGMYASSDKFREFMFGKDGTGKDEKSFTGLIRTKIINNVDEIAHNTLNMIRGIGRRIVYTVSGIGATVLNWLAGKSEKISKNHPLIGKLLGLPGAIAKAPVKLAGGILGFANEKIQGLNIRRGDEVYDRKLGRNLNAKERLDTFGNYSGSELDRFLMNADADQMSAMKNNLSTLVNSKQASKTAFINNANTYFNKIKATLSTDTIRDNVSTLNSMYKAMKEGNIAKVEKEFNKLKSNANISGETENLVGEATKNMAELSDNKVAIAQAKKLLSSLGLDVKKSGKLATYLNRITSEMKIKGYKDTSASIDEDKAKDKSTVEYQRNILSALNNIYNAMPNKPNKDGSVTYITDYGPVKYHLNNQEELEPSKNDSNTDETQKKAEETHNAINKLPEISSKLGVFGGMFKGLKDFFSGNEEEKKEGIFDKLFKFLGIGSGVTLKTVLTTALAGLGLGLGFTGALDNIANKVSEILPILRGNDTGGGTLSDRSSTTVTLNDGSVVPVVTDAKGNPEITTENGQSYYTTLDGSKIPVNYVTKVNKSSVNHSLSSDLKRNLFSGSSIGLTMATGDLKYLGIGGKTYSKVAGKVGTIGSNIGKAVSNVGPTIKQLAARIKSVMKDVGEFLAKKIPKGKKLADEVSDELVKAATQSADDVAEQAAKKAGKEAAEKAGEKAATKAIPIIGWIIYGLDIVGCATDCWGNAESVLGIVDEATTGQRVIASIIGALNAAIPFIGNLVPNNIIVNIIVTAGQAIGLNFGSLIEQRSAASDIVSKYNSQTGSSLSIEEYNQMGIEYDASSDKFTQGKSRSGWKYKAITNIKKFGNYISDELDKTTLGRGLKSVYNIEKDLFKLNTFVPKGDIKGLWGYDPNAGEEEDDKIGSMGKAIIGIAKIINTPRTLMNNVATTILDVIVDLAKKIPQIATLKFKESEELLTMMQTSENPAQFFQKVYDDIQADYAAAHEDDTGMGGFFAAGQIIRKVISMPMAIVKFVGTSVAKTVSDYVTNIPAKINNLFESQETMFGFVRDGKPLELFTYGTPLDKESNDELGFAPITKAVLGVERVLLAPLTLISAAGHKIGDFINNISGATLLDAQAVEDDFNRLGKLAASNDWESIRTFKENPKISKISFLYTAATKIGRAFYMTTSILGSVFDTIGNLLNPIISKIETTSSWFDNAKGKIKEGWDEFWGGLLGAGSGIPSGGSSGFVSQYDSRYANKRYAGTTFGDKGCGPAVASMAARSLGKNLSVDTAIAKSNKYQNANGTSINYFKDALSGTGAKTRYLAGKSMKQDALNSLSRGEKVIMLGRDSSNYSKANSPFGPNNHYVLATGIDRNGNIRVNDPEARGPRTYNASKLLNGMRMGVAAGGKSGLSVDASKFNNAGLSQEEMGRRARNQIVNNKTANRYAKAHNKYELPEDVALDIYKNAANLAEAKQLAANAGFTDESAVTKYYNEIKNERNVSFEGDMPQNNAEKVWAYFASKGLPAEGIAGILGNMKRESQVDPQRVQGDHSADLVFSNNYTANVDNGNISRDDFVHKGPNGNGYGLVQFTYHTWKEMLYDSAKANNTSIGDLNNQLEQVNTQAKDAISYLRTVTSPEDAAYAFLRKYENPQCDDAVDIRKANAREFYEAYKDRKFRWDGVTYSAPLRGGDYGSDYGSLGSSSGGEKHTIFNLISRLSSIFSSFGQNQEDDSDTYNPNQTGSTSGSTAASGIGNSSIQGGMANNFPYFNQADEPWGSQPYGSHNTIKGAACGPTSMAMVMKSYGINTDPLQTANWSADHGHRAQNGTDWTFFNDIGSTYGLKVNQLEGYGKSNSAVIQALNSKYPVIASMGPGDFTKGGHFIVLSGLTPDGNILVNDPGNRTRTQKSPWSPADNVLNQAKQFWVVSDSNGIGSIGGYTANVGKATGRDIPEWQKAEYQQKNYASGVADTSGGDSGLESSNGISSAAVNALLQSIAKLLENVSDNSDYISKIYGVLAKYIGTEDNNNKTTGSTKTSYKPTRAKELSANLIELSTALANIAKG